MVTDSLNALERIPKLIEQYQAENAKLEKDLPTLREIVSGEWKKEEELKELKFEVAVLERKIQLTLTPPEQAGKEGAEQKHEGKVVLSANNDRDFVKDHLIIAHPKPFSPEAPKGFKI